MLLLMKTWRHGMNMTTACRCIITLSLVSVAVPAQTAASAGSPSGQALAFSAAEETKKPSTAGTADSAKMTPRRTTPSDKPREGLVTTPNRAQEVEARVRSGQMDQPIAQGEISERLNQLEAGSKSFSEDAAARQ